MKKIIFSPESIRNCNEIEECNCEEFIFGLPISGLSKLKKLKKGNILTIACEKENPNYIIIQTSNPNKNKKINKLLHKYCTNSDSKEIKSLWGKTETTIFKRIVQNYIIELPQGYCDIPIISNNTLNITSLWKKDIFKKDKVIIKLKKNSIDLIFEDDEEEFLYKKKFKTKDITDIIKIFSFGRLRIYYGKDLPLLFSTIDGNINLYVCPTFDFRIHTTVKTEKLKKLKNMDKWSINKVWF